jgi:alkylation response protein AidB-like acyl-CoA dehydrogenase
MFVVDMHAPGITVRPLRQMTGDAHFNEVFLDAAPVAVNSVLGEVHGGWNVARTMLGFERQALGGMGSGGSGRGGIKAIEGAARERGILQDAEVRDRLADLRIRQMVLRYLGSYLQANRAKATGGEAAILKLAMARLVQHVAYVATDIAGPGAVAWDPQTPGASRWSSQLLNSPSASLGGGTNEIVRNVIAERVLGLPRDTEVDADTPFRELKVGTQRDG